MRRLAAILVLLLASCGGGGGGAPGAPPMAPTVFAATWTASPQDLDPETISDRTLRQIVRISAGGPSLRLRFSNLFGDAPVTVTEARIAKSVGGSSVDAATDRRLTVNGTATFALPARGEVTSDEIPLPLSAGDDLAVSLYLAAPATLMTGHKSSTSTTYIASGNAAAAAAFPSAEMRAVTCWLDEIDVSAAPGDIKVIVAFGDSITEGSESTAGAHKSYPEQLFARVAAQVNPRMSVVNAGIGGNRWLQDSPGPSGSSRFGRDVLGVQGVTHTIILLGINDFEGARLFGTPPVTSDQLIAATAAAISTARARGVKVLLGTLLPYKGSSLFNSDDELQRETYNTWVRQSSGADAIVDFDRALRDPADPLALAPQYASPDRLHPNDGGYGVMASIVDVAALR